MNGKLSEKKFFIYPVSHKKTSCVGSYSKHRSQMRFFDGSAEIRCTGTHLKAIVMDVVLVSNENHLL